MKEHTGARPSPQFIGLIKSFSFDCKSRPNRINGLPHSFGKAVGNDPAVGLNRLLGKEEKS